MTVGAELLDGSGCVFGLNRPLEPWRRWRRWRGADRIKTERL